MSAIQDALNEKKFRYVWTLLSKVSDNNQLKTVDENGRNLFHTFAIQGNTAPIDMTKKINKAFIQSGIDFKVTDKEGRTPLHYAASNGFGFLVEELLNSNVDPNVQDKKGFTAFSLQLVDKTSTVNENTIQAYIKAKANLALKFKVQKRGEESEQTPLTYLIGRGIKNFELFKILINHGVSINDTDDDGCSPLIYAIRNNSKKVVKFFLNFAQLDKDQKDNDGKTPIHHVVQPMEFASYENEEILALLAKHFDVNKADDQNKAPIYYAYLQDSGVMAKKLIELGAKDTKPPAGIQRAATSVISTAKWEDEVDYEEDAEKFLEKAAEAEKQVMTEEKKCPVDQYVKDSHLYEVVTDENLGPYDLFMTKVDLKKGYYGGNLFYRMQVLHQANRDVYIYFTRYGRIGTPGEYQTTAAPSKEKAIEEFEKIFKSKSGNDWANKEHFKKQPGKYQLLTFTRKTNQKEYIMPFELKNPKTPKSKLDDEIKKIMEDVTQLKHYQSIMRNYHIDTDYLPLAKLSKQLIVEAQQFLFEIKELQEKLNELQTADKQDYDAQLEVKEKIAGKSSRFYEIIPDNRYKDCPVPPIEDEYSLKEKSDMINNLLDFEVTSKVLLGALYHSYKINPLDYCFQALNTRVLRLEEESGEFQIIKDYIAASWDGGDVNKLIKNVFAIERKGEKERISQWSHLKNRMLLWHGSKVANFLGILSQGLKVAPPEAPVTGYMYGKGIYFADQFALSYNYTNDWMTNLNCGYKLMLLCEVALGD